jgi:hypothetical protein
MKKLDRNVAVKTKDMTEDQYDEIVEIMDMPQISFCNVKSRTFIEFWIDHDGFQQVDYMHNDLEVETKEIITAEEFINKYGDNNEGEVVMNNSKSGEHNESPISFEFGGAESGVLTLADVEEDQFFVDKDGWLGQKVGRTGYVLIAADDGEPCCTVYEDADEYEVIQRVLPKVTKINF